MALYSAFLFNGAAYTPEAIDRELVKVGETNVADDGTRNFVQRVNAANAPTFKQVWTFTFTANEATRAALVALAKLTTTWSLRDLEGVTSTVQTEADSYRERWRFRAANGQQYHEITLKVYEA